MKSLDGCVCGSGKKSVDCCSDTIHDFAEGEVFMLYRQLGDMRRQMKALVSGRSHLEASVEPQIDRSLVVYGEPLGPECSPEWNGRRLTRELIAYPGREWSDERGAIVQEKLYMLSEAFGDYLIEHLGADVERVTDFEAIVESFGDFLLMYYLSTPLDVKPGHQAARRFVGNYYPRTFLDANINTVYTALTALPAYYAYLSRLGLATLTLAEAVAVECRDWPWYRRRFEEYHAVVGKARARWCRELDYKAMPVG